MTERSIDELRKTETAKKGRKVKKREKEEGKKAGGRKGRVKAVVWKRPLQTRRLHGQARGHLLFSGLNFHPSGSKEAASPHQASHTEALFSD